MVANRELVPYADVGDGAPRGCPATAHPEGLWLAQVERIVQGAELALVHHQQLVVGVVLDHTKSK